MTAEASRGRVVGAARLVQGAGPAVLGSNVAYPLYVVGLLAAIYGHSLARAVVLVANPAILAAALSSWPALVVGAGLGVLGLRAVYRAGRTRGPATPPLPWVELVVATDVDRAEALQGWWWQSVFAVCGGFLILSATIGGALWTSSATGPGAFAASLVAGPAAGWLVAALWLAGQAGFGDRPAAHPGSPWARALRRIRLDDLRAQSARASAVAAGLSSGDARAALAPLTTPVTAGRHLRLRPGRPSATMVRRDVLGLRRAPESLARGVLLCALAGAGVGWSAALPGRSLVLAVLLSLVGHAGGGALADGLRRQADRGADTLLGLSWPREFAAHLVVPVLVTGAATVGPALLSAPADLRMRAAGTALGLAAVVLGSHCWAAFRRPSPYPAYLPNGRLFAGVWYAVPLVVSGLCGGYVVHHLPIDPGAALPWLLAAPITLALGLGGAARPHRPPR